MPRLPGDNHHVVAWFVVLRGKTPMTSRFLALSCAEYHTVLRYK